MELVEDGCEYVIEIKISGEAKGAKAWTGAGGRWR